jgi:CHAT domain-containing protein
VVDDALTRFARSDDDAAWSLRVLRGELLNNTGTCRDVIAYFAKTQLPSRLAKARPAVDRLSALGLAQSHCNDVSGARASFVSAQKIAHALDAEAEARVLVRKADFEIATRAWTEAERDSKSLIAAQNPRFQSRGWAALGKLRGQQERFDEAIDANERALQIASANTDPGLSLVVRMNLGWLLVASGDYDRAAEMLTIAEADATRLGRKNDRIVALMQLGNAKLAQDQPVEAARNYEQALVLANELESPLRATLLDNLARVAFASGDATKAKTLNAQALDLQRDAAERMRSLAMSGRIEEKLGDVTAAETLFRRVIAEAPSRLARFESTYFLASLHSNHGQRSAAAREFKQALSMADAARAELKSEELKLAYTTTLAAVVNDSIEFLVVEGRAVDALRVAEASRARTLADGLGVAGKDVAPADLRSVARARGPILSYWLTPRVSFLWIVTPESIDVVRLPPQADVAAAVEGYLRDIAGPRGTLEMSGERGQQLWSMLVEPVAKSLANAKRVAIVGDKQLHALNFETLVAPGPRPHYWIEDVTITTAASIGLLGRPDRGGGAARTMFLVGDPQPPDPSLPPLKWAGEEIGRIRAHFPRATVIAQSDATAAGYAEHVTAGFAYVHFVAHGIGSATRPLDSAIVLANSKLYARDILRHRLNARLVTVSSCHGAGQRAFAGEGLVGLAWAFLRAGAHQVIAALWEVSDSATPQLMDAMYARIGKGDDPAAALREAKLALLRSNSVYRRPLYWAPFVLYSGT